MEKNYFRKFSKRKKIVLIISAVFACSLILLYSPFLLNEELYKDLILRTIRESIDYKLKLGSSKLKIFPFPGISLMNLEVYDPHNESEIMASAGQVDISISWTSIILKKIRLSDISVQDGHIKIIRNKEGKFNIVKTDPGNKSSPSSDLFRSNSIAIGSVSFYNFTVDYRDLKDRSRNRNVYILRIDSDFSGDLRSGNINFYGKVDDEKVEVYAKVARGKSEGSYLGLIFNAKVILDNLSASLLKDYFYIFPNANFSESKLKGTFFLSKETDDGIRIKVESILSKFAFRGGNFFPPLSLNSEFEYYVNQDKISFSQFSVDWTGIARGRGKGILGFGNEGYFNTSITSDFVTVDPVLSLIKLFTFRIPGSKPSGKFRSNYSLNLRNVQYLGFKFNHCNLEMQAVDTDFHVSKASMKIFDGEILATGDMSFRDIPFYRFDVAASSLHADKIIGHYSEEKYITGLLEGAAQISTKGKNTQELFRHLYSSGNFLIYNGELLGYANILKPIALFGKLGNILGPKGKSTGFQYLKSEFRVKNEEVNFKKIKMNGVGIDIEGRGTIGFNKEIDMRFTVGLGGLLGKAIKIPVIYYGIMPENLAYIDPIWIGSVYAGAILGLPGTIVGGPFGGAAAGSVASEYVRDFWDGFTGLFTTKKSDKE
ncbi:MAG: AsmA family protein [Leptospira sp.]|nr:AsmA family protein [Leptospira sp.]